MDSKELAGLLREAAWMADIEMNGVDGAYVVSRISTVIDTLEKAAEGVEPVAWRFRFSPESPWQYSDTPNLRDRGLTPKIVSGAEVEAMYTTPPAAARDNHPGSNTPDSTGGDDNA